jgi:hypothetical protein
MNWLLSTAIKSCSKWEYLVMSPAGIDSYERVSRYVEIGPAILG